MAKRAPKLRKHLSADALLSKLRSGFADIAEHRSGEVNISLSDALMSACAMFSLKAPSLLAFDKERTEDNLQRVYGDVHDILGVNEGDHAFLFHQVAQAERAGRVTYYEREEAETGAHHRLRFVSDMPLNASNAEVRVNFLECWETLNGQVQHCSWVTDLRVNKGTVHRLMQGGRARWRIENETFNTLNNQGYHFEHNFGHGYQHLSVVFAMLMMLAFLVDQVQQLCCPLFQTAWAKWGSKRLRWEKMRALFYTYALASMEHLFQALLYGFKKPAPILDVDSS